VSRLGVERLLVQPAVEIEDAFESEYNLASATVNLSFASVERNRVDQFLYTS